MLDNLEFKCLEAREKITFYFTKQGALHTGRKGSNQLFFNFRFYGFRANSERYVQAARSNLFSLDALFITLVWAVLTFFDILIQLSIWKYLKVQDSNGATMSKYPSEGGTHWEFVARFISEL